MTGQDALGAARSRWWLPALGIVLGLVAAGVVTWQTTPLYRSSTQVFVGQTGSAAAADAYAAGLFAQQRALSYATLAESEDVLRAAADGLGLDLPMAELTERVSARSVPETGIIEVTVTDPSAARAQQLADAVGEEFTAEATAVESSRGRVGAPVSFTTIRSAPRPTEPISPDATRNLSFGALAGLLAGLLLVALPPRSTRTVTHSDDVRDWSGTELLATLSGVPDTAAFSRLRTRLLGGGDGPPPRVVVVAATGPDGPRPDVAAGLAEAIARAGLRVALLDARPLPVGTAVPEGPGDPGLTDLLAGKATLEEVLRVGEEDRPDVIPAGTVDTLDASAVHASPALAGTLRTLTRSHDVVVVDSPALNPVPDAAVLGAAADGCLLVAPYRRTGQRELADAAATLSEHGARLLGVVLDGVPARRARALGLRYDYPVDEDRRSMLPPVGRRIVAGGGSPTDEPAPAPGPVGAPSAAEPGVS